MKYRSVEEIRQAAIVSPIHTPTPWSCAQRLAWWAQLIESHGGDLNLLQGIENVPVYRRDVTSEQHSPLSLAYSDPMFRAQGLAGETYGDAQRFFGISGRRMHRIVCACLYFHGPAVSSRLVATQIRRAATRARHIECVVTMLGLGQVVRALVVRMAV